MDKVVSLTRILVGGAVGLALVAVVAQIVWRLPTASAHTTVLDIPAPSSVNMTDPQHQLVADSVAVATIVATNIFSPDRTPPRRRWRAPDAAPLADAAAAMEARPSGPAPLRLYGITLTPGDTAALIEADAKVPGAERYRLGDTVRGARLVALTDSTAVLESSAGRSVLRLSARRRAGQ